jgi:4-hydroxybenzoyl-CoA thioesterase/acyl-CoA thioester hydrolase
MAEPFRTSRLVEFHDTDMAGIMHFASFFHYMESAEHELLRSLGLSVHTTVDGEMLSFPRVATSCEFRSPARCEEILDIAIRIPRLGSKSITYDFDFRSGDRAVATGQITCVCCRVVPGKPLESVKIPADVSEKLRQYVS